MAKFSDQVGFVCTVEDPPESGIFKAKETRRKYFGDIRSLKTQSEPGEGANADIQLNVEISIVADSFAKKHIGYMRYVVMDGVAWAIKNARTPYPRIVLTIGGLYHGT